MLKKMIVAALALPVIAYAGGDFEGMNEAAVFVKPISYQNIVKNALPSSLNIVEKSQNQIYIDVNVQQGGTLSGNRIEYGTVKLEVYRDADVLIEKRAAGKKAKTKPQGVMVWFDSILTYDDSHTGLSPHIPGIIRELIGRSGL